MAAFYRCSDGARSARRADAVAGALVPWCSFIGKPDRQGGVGGRRGKLCPMPPLFFGGGEDHRERAVEGVAAISIGGVETAQPVQKQWESALVSSL